MYLTRAKETPWTRAQLNFLDRVPVSSVRLRFSFRFFFSTFTPYLFVAFSCPFACLGGGCLSLNKLSRSIFRSLSFSFVLFFFEPLSKVPIYRSFSVACLGHDLLLSFAYCRVNSGLVLHIVRRKDPVIQGSSFSFLHDVSISDASVLDHGYPFIRVCACLFMYWRMSICRRGWGRVDIHGRRSKVRPSDLRKTFVRVV